MTGKPAKKRTAKIVSGGFLILILAWQHIQATRLGYQVEKSRQEIHKLRGKTGLLQMELETSLSPSQLASKAKNRLGMFPAAPESLRILEAPLSSTPQETVLKRWISRALFMVRLA
ncbi:MAG: hypothetical protein HY921_01665 [Elusimicrobia bacterium]|nr:hypothetical protein [Elusimicrobiota bacterium]